MRRVLIAWELGGHLGHLGRLLPIAWELRERGVAVAFAVRNLNEGMQLPGEWTLLQAPGNGRRAGSGRGAVNHADLLVLDGFDDAPGVRARVRAWMGLFSLFQPAAVLADFSPMALLAAQVAGVPAVPIGHGFEIPPVDAGQAMPSFQPWKPDAPAQAQAAQTMDRAFKELRRTFGGKAPSAMQDLYPSDGSALCVWPELDHFGRAPGSSRFTGPLWGDLSAANTTPPWPDKPGPKVLCYLRPQGDSHALFFHSLGLLGCNVLLIAPGLPVQAASLARGRGIAVHTQTLPLAPLLDEASAVVTHGGMGLVAMVLQRGLPLLVLPSNAEQMILARRLASQGLCIASTRLKHQPTLQDKVGQLIDQGASESTGAYRTKYAGYTPQTGAQNVCALLEAVVGAAQS